jgi:hypothetical protein
MANVDKVVGFRPYRYANGASYNGAANRYVIPASDGQATMVGDLVTLHTTGDDATGLRCVTRTATNSTNCVGVVVGFEVDPASLNTPQFRAASTRRIVLVADDPDMLLVGQEDGDTDPLESTDIGQNVNIVVTAGSTVTGASGMEIDSDTHNTTVTLPLKLMEFVATPDNENVLSTGGQAFSRWAVKINTHPYRSTSAV